MVWSGSDEPVLIRNYDLDPALHEGIILHSAWNGRQVIAVNECLWGADDGMNDAGLVVSITFGGRNIVGDGFGIPIILRYILELCETTAEAVEVLRRVPSHMAYNVTLLDRQGDYATAFVSPDRPTQVTRKPVATNHQQSIEWPEHARFSRTLERERFLTEQLADAGLTEEALLRAFLRAPLFNTHYRHGFGTLYTAIYRPLQGKVEFHWPDGSWLQSFESFEEGRRTVRYSQFTGTDDRHALQSTMPEARQGEQAPRFRLNWELEDFSVAGIMKQVFTGVLDTFDAGGNPVPEKVRRELMNDLERGHIPWEKLGTLWTGGDESPFGSRVEVYVESADKDHAWTWFNSR
jgi:hypothetical protein